MHHIYGYHIIYMMYIIYDIYMISISVSLSIYLSIYIYIERVDQIFQSKFLNMALGFYGQLKSIVIIRVTTKNHTKSLFHGPKHTLFIGFTSRILLLSLLE